MRNPDTETLRELCRQVRINAVEALDWSKQADREINRPLAALLLVQLDAAVATARRLEDELAERLYQEQETLEPAHGH